MAVTSELTTIHSCEQATDASTSCVLSSTSGGAFTGDAGEKVEGTYAYGFDLDIETHTVTFTPSTNLNLTSQVLWVWMKFLTSAYLGTWTNGAVKVRLTDSVGDWSEWYLTGSDRAGGRYTRYPVYLGSTPDAVSATLDLTDVDTIIFSFTGIGKSKLTYNCFIDYLQYGAVGAGIKITGGGVGTEEDFDDIVGDDEAIAAGLAEKVDGVFFMNGPWNFGDSATNSVYFKDTNQIIVSKDHYRSFTTTNRTSAESLVSSDHNQLNVQNYATGTGNFQLGSVVGGRGVSGCVFKTGGNRLVQFDFNDSDIDILKLYGCEFKNCATFAFPPAISGSEVVDCIWNTCGIITPNTFKFRYCKNVNATSDGFSLATVSWDMENIDCINPTDNGITFSVGGSVSFTSINFAGTDGVSNYDVENTNASTLTINVVSNSSNVQYKNENPGTITIVNPITFKLIGLASNTEVTIVRVSDSSVLFHEENSSGDVTYQYNSGGTVVDVLIFHIDYDIDVSNLMNYTMPTIDTSVPITQVHDLNYNNP